MVVLVCTPQQGWAGVEGVLRLAEPGTRVQLRSGQYAGATTLELPAGVELRGEEGVELSRSSGDGPVLRVSGADCSLTALQFLGTSSAQTLVHAMKADGLLVENCAFEGAGLATTGLWIQSSQRVKVLRCQTRKFVDFEQGISNSSIELWSSTGVVESCECLASQRGIMVVSETGEPVSDVSVVGNRCGFNDRVAIVFVASRGEVRNNDCWGSQSGHGISIECDESETRPSEVLVVANRCHGNQGSGIAFFSSRGTVRDNDCWGSLGLPGICIKRGSSKESPPSEVLVEGNRSYENYKGGIVFSASLGQIKGNDCWGSRNGSGIAIESDETDALPSEVVVEGNRCHGNESSGIAFSSSRGAVRNNECWGSLGSHGVCIQCGDTKDAPPSKVSVEGNRCYDNWGCGIAFVSSLGTARNNDCWGSLDLHGICIQRDITKDAPPSEVLVEGNRCFLNKEAGIGFHSSVGVVRDNDCWGSQSQHGICIQRASRDGALPSDVLVEGNRCYENHGIGIAFFSSRGTVRNNECWGSITSLGVAIHRDDRDDASPSDVLVEGNRCHDNQQAGIAFFSSKGTVRSNDCWGSLRRHGICLERRTEPDSLPSEVLVEGNRCYSNELSGIACLSSRGELLNNVCWGSRKAEGIFVGQDRVGGTPLPSFVKVEGNHCYQNADAGIMFTESRGSVANNVVWGNAQGAIVLKGSADVLESGNRTDLLPAAEALWRDRTASHPLAPWLLAHAARGEEALMLAGFLSSGGCSHCLRRFWNSGHPPEAGHAQDSGATAPRLSRGIAQRLQQYRVSRGKGDGALIDSEPLADAAIHTAVDALTASLSGLGRQIARKDGRKAEPLWSVALISADDASLIPWLDGAAASEALTRGARRERERARPVKADVVHIEMLGRALQWRTDRAQQQLGSHTPSKKEPEPRDAGFLEAGLSSPRTFKSRWLARLSAEVPWLDAVFSAAIVSGLLYLLLEHWGIPVQAWLKGNTNVEEARATLVSGWQAKSWWSVFMEGGSILAAVFAIGRWLWNRVLPLSLKMQWSRGDSDLGKWLASWHVWPNALRWFAHSEQARRQWLRRRLFPRRWTDGWPWQATRVTVLVLTNLDQPSEADLAELRSIVKLRPRRRPLLIVSQMSGMSMLVNAYLDVWFCSDGSSDLRDVKGRIFHDAASAHAAPLVRTVDPGQTLDSLRDILGWPEGQGNQPWKLDDSKQRWGAEELAPALVMGSTPHLYMAFESNQGNRVAEDFLREIDAFTNTIARLDPTVGNTLENELTGTAIGNLEVNLSDRASGVLVTRSTQVPWRGHTWWIGRVGLRVRLAQAVVDLYLSNGRSMEEARQYLAELCLPGLRHHLLKAGSLAQVMDKPNASRTVLHLRSVLFLLQEQFSLSPGLACLAQVEEEWSFLSALHAVPRVAPIETEAEEQPEVPDDLVRLLEQCWLLVFSAQSLYANHQRAAPATSAIVEEVQARLWRCIDVPFAVETTDPNVHVLEYGLSEFMTRLATIPESTARVLLDRRLEGSWRAMPDRFQQRLREQLPLLSTFHLRRCLHGVSSLEALLSAIKTLRTFPGLVIGTLGVLSSGGLLRQAMKPGVSRSEIYQPVAQSLLVLRDAAGPLATLPSRLPDLRAHIRGNSLLALEDAAAALLSDPEAVGRLSALFERQEDSGLNLDAPVFEGVALGVHSNVGRAEKRLKEMYLSS